jgi:hypothetical protein
VHAVFNGFPQRAAIPANERAIDGSMPCIVNSLTTVGHSKDKSTVFDRKLSMSERGFAELMRISLPWRLNSSE